MGLPFEFSSSKKEIRRKRKTQRRRKSHVDIHSFSPNLEDEAHSVWVDPTEAQADTGVPFYAPYLDESYCGTHVFFGDDLEQISSCSVLEAPQEGSEHTGSASQPASSTATTTTPSVANGHLPPRGRSLWACGQNDGENPEPEASILRGLSRHQLDPEQEVVGSPEGAYDDSIGPGALESSHENAPHEKRARFFEPVPDHIAEHIAKYWGQRYRLFTRFDEGIQLDDEGWYSVTPEAIAFHLAQRCACDVIVDAFCGVGGNTIQFAMTCERVIAIDLDPVRLAMAKHNAKVYGVEDRIEFILGDALEVVPMLKADVVFASPPWGGPEYLTMEIYDAINLMEPPIDLIYSKFSMATKNICFLMPRNSNVLQLVRLGGPGCSCEIEQNFLDRKFKTLTAYYGDIVLPAQKPRDSH